MPRSLLVTFHPICSTPHGRNALLKYPHLVPFSDGSCRREPDLQVAYPSITALCRGGNFAPTLEDGDRVFYMSVKGRYPNHGDGWALVAALEVIHTLPDHSEAAAWYTAQREPLPSNCMVPGNPCLPLDQTSGLPSLGLGMQQSWTQNGLPPKNLAAWDAHYAARATKFPHFVVTSPITACRLTSPRVVGPKELAPIFDAGKVPGTQNFKELSPEEFDRLLAMM